MASLLSSRQSSLASQLLQKNIAICPSPCGSGLARDGSAAVFKAGLAGKPAPTEKHRNLPLPLWERACPRWQRRCLQGRARWQASSYRKTPQSAPPPVGAGLPAMAAPLSSRQSSLASQRLQKNTAICPSPCGSGLARDGVAAVFKAKLAGKPVPTEKHRNLPPPPVGAGLPAMAAPLSSRQSSPASQLLQKNTAISRLPLWERACPRWRRCWLQARARWQASAYRKASQSPASPCGSGLARDGSAAVFKAELAGKPAPTEKHRNLPPPPVRAGLPAMASLLASSQSSLASQLLQKSIAISHSPCGSGLARHIGDEPLTLCVNCSRSR